MSSSHAFRTLHKAGSDSVLVDELYAMLYSDRTSCCDAGSVQTAFSQAAKDDAWISLLSASEDDFGVKWFVWVFGDNPFDSVELLCERMSFFEFFDRKPEV